MYTYDIAKMYNNGIIGIVRGVSEKSPEQLRQTINEQKCKILEFAEVVNTDTRFVLTPCQILTWCEVGENDICSMCRIFENMKGKVRKC